MLGMLGPNGAGKTTTVRMMTTLTTPDQRHRPGGRPRRGQRARRRAPHRWASPGRRPPSTSCSPAGRTSASSAPSTGSPRPTSSGPATTCSSGSRLTDAGDRVVKTYSGGMRRRLDLAVSLIATPPVLFLDEPTTGLDPRSRVELWEVLRELVRDGTTLLLTTQYLEEADQLADRIVVIDRGRVIAEGTPLELKDQSGQAALVVTVSQADDLPIAEGCCATTSPRCTSTPVPAS